MLPALIMNILTDICIMAIPAPAILTVRTTLQRKISLVIIFSAGIFVMIAAILRVSMVLVGGDGGTAAIWSCREDFVAICVGQAPICECCWGIPLNNSFPGNSTDYGHFSTAHFHQTILDRRDVLWTLWPLQVNYTEPERQRRIRNGHGSQRHPPRLEKRHEQERK